MNRVKHLGLLFGTILLFSGCSHTHPQSQEFLNQAKGPTGVTTAQNLIGMMETSLQQAKTESGESPGLTTLHDQFHALRHSLCEATDAQVKTATYDKAVTIQKEMKTVFHRLWDYKDDPTRRTLHLDLFSNRLQKLRQALQAI